MNDELLFAIELADPSGEFEPASELLNALEVEFSSFFDRENCTVRHTVYSLTMSEAEALHERLAGELAGWREFGVELEMGDIFTIAKSEWAEAWKKYFKPVEISEKLLIRPSWLEDVPRPGQKLLQIDPGMSFGTGQHATTNYCLKCIDRFAGKKKRLLDAGCGSGILAIAGALLDYEVIDAFDFDPEAVKVAGENAALNQVAGKIAFSTGNAADWPGRPDKYDLVCANILGHLLIAFRFNIINWVAPDGVLVLSGILDRDFDKVCAAFSEVGMTEIERYRDKDWTSGIFAFNADAI
ncbi:MAG: 50S ribosomal protein L11 methyltransferase [Lentisphaeria bacterium]|nr:50S ribosomal protein L11 methyltransferase [Lentisphaeria bacterium]